MEKLAKNDARKVDSKTLQYLRDRAIKLRESGVSNIETVQETRDDVSSKFSVYSLLFPPVSLEKYIANNGGGSVSRVWLVLAVAAVVGGGVWISVS